MRIEDPLPARIREILQKEVSRVKRIDIRQLAKKKNIILGIAILILGSGLFLYPALEDEMAGFFSEKKAYAQEKDGKKTEISDDVIDPLHKIGQGIMTKDGKISQACVAEKEPVKKEQKKLENPAMSAMLAGFPMEEMIPALNGRDKEVSAYLVAIAKKESNWGKHTPKKNGKECYNYWGYRGKENTTDSGYSCFDSPAHAVEVVGNRIEKLLDQNINTPAKMVVWKCGRDCEAAGGQAAANKWIADVAAYYNKLNS